MSDSKFWLVCSIDRFKYVLDYGLDDAPDGVVATAKGQIVKYGLTLTSQSFRDQCVNERLRCERNVRKVDFDVLLVCQRRKIVPPRNFAAISLFSANDPASSARAILII